MREQVSRHKKTTTGFSIPTLKNPVRGFGLDSAPTSPPAASLLEPLNQPPGHDISRISLSPQAKLTPDQTEEVTEQTAELNTNNISQMNAPGSAASIPGKELANEQQKPAELTMQQFADSSPTVAEVQTPNKTLGHDISRISLRRPQTKALLVTPASESLIQRRESPQQQTEPEKQGTAEPVASKPDTQNQPVSPDPTEKSVAADTPPLAGGGMGNSPPADGKPNVNGDKGGDKAAPESTVVNQQPTTNISAEDPGQILEQLKNTPPTQAFTTYSQAETASAKALENQKKQLQATIPEIPAPTGLTSQTNVDVANNSASTTPQSKQPVPEPGQPNPVSGNIGASFGGVSSLFSAIASSTTHQGQDSNQISTSAGERPKLNLTGDADPAQMNAEQQQSASQVQQAKAQANSETYRDFGENNIYPQASKEILKANQEISQIAPPSSQGGELPVISEEIAGGLNQGLTPYYQSKIAPEQEKYAAGKQKFDLDSVTARQNANKEIQNLNQETTNKQIETKKLAQQEVAQAKQNWQQEIDTAEKDYQEKAGKATKEQRQKVEEEKTKGEAQADQHLQEAEQKAEAEKKKAEDEEAKKREEAEKEKEKQSNQSGWDKFWGGVTSFFSSIVEGLKTAINFIYDNLRKAVKFIFEAAKKLAMAAIDLARNVIVGIIQGLGAILKGLVQIVFAAFPEISKKFTNAIDQAVNKATEVVNAAADFLKKAVSSVLDFLAKTLDTLLGLVQSLYNGALTVIGMLIRGEFAELAKRFSNLIAGAKAMPPQFETAALEELMGGEVDLDKPLAPEELAQAQAIGVNIPHTEVEGTPQTGETAEMPSAPWSEENVGVDAVEEDMELSPELTAEVMEQTQGEGEIILAESQEENRSMDAIISEAVGEQQVGEQQEPEPEQIPDDGLSPRQRASIKWEMMKQGIKQWFSDNWPKLLAGLIAAAAVIIAAIIASGGAILSALPIIMEILTVVFAAEAIAKIGGHLRDYLSKSWDGDIQSGGKSLAKALAAGAIEVIMYLTFKAGEVAAKGAKAAAKGLKTAAKGVANVAKRAYRGIIKGAKYLIEKGKVLFKGIAGTKLGNQFKRLRNFGEALLERMRFKAFRIRVANGWFRLEGLINPWVLIAQGKITQVEKGTEGAVEITDDAFKMVNDFMNKRAGLKNPDAIKLFDQKYKAIVGDATDPKKINNFERYLKSVINKGDGDLETGFIKDLNANKQVEVPTNQRFRFGERVKDLPRLRQEAEDLIEEINAWLRTDPGIKRGERIIKTIDNDLKGPMKRMEEGIDEASKARVEGFENNLKGARSEFERAKTAPPGTEIGGYIKFQGKKIEIDQIRPDGKWINVKNYELFGLNNPKIDELITQAEMNLRAAEANLVNGTPPTVVFDFPKGVTPEVATRLRSIQLNGRNVQVTGPEIPLPPSQ
ncbi:hypothetical protein H6G33_12210 [Calothrix sp. FACHB-1219]|uniref:hypothetical protein n=1 Tax=unclassified Calothrix TaxID=2619626 RepID=UPI0016829FC3|nr:MULTISPECIES: hypothetical protein [unclassified Calothrix]MBD2202614.1 hypothetical protein [Calothrix sp. FACHB-168]MBD2217796.1 hypothetical protein [Calothrix sp. FACHB-1219]